MKSTRMTSLVFVLVLFTSLTAQAWKFKTVDSTSNTGLFTSIAVDSLDKVHISYIDWTNGMLKYASDASGDWATMPVGNTGVEFAGLYTSLALDSSDMARVSYIDWTNGMLKYTIRWGGIVWWTFDLNSAGTEALFTSLALDSSDRVHISYYDVTNDDLRYVTNAPGSWMTDAVDWTGQVGMYSSITVDGSDKAHISYWGSEGLTYATNASGAWVITSVDWDENGGLYTSIVLDSSDDAHISYYDVTNTDLRYATNASGDWVVETLDSDGDVGWDTSIALDSSDNVHISYYDDTNADLKHVTDASGSWMTEVVDSIGDVGMYSSIAVDSRDYLRISYYNESQRNLKYAYTTPCVDNDGDGYGDPGDPWCPMGPETDCDDTNGSRSPGGTETCDGLDNDCDGSVPSDEVDEDGDGYLLCANDCDDDNPAVNPGVIEGPFRDPLCSDTVDNNCNGKVDLADSQCCECIDNDRDGYGQPVCIDCPHSLWDCDDTEPNANPGMTENCKNGIDDDCDGWIDEADIADCEPATWTAAEASEYGPSSREASGVLSILAIFLLPIGAATLLKSLRRR